MTDNEAVEDDGKKEKASLLHFAIPIVPCAPSLVLSKALQWLKNKAFAFEFKYVWNHMNYEQSRTGEQEYDYKTGRQKFLLPINH